MAQRTNDNDLSGPSSVNPPITDMPPPYTPSVRAGHYSDDITSHGVGSIGVVGTNVGIKMNIVSVGPEPTQVTCPSCRATILTRIEHKATTRTHVVALVLCLFLCWPCICVPYCVNSCQNADHYCPNCNSYLGTYSR